MSLTLSIECQTALPPAVHTDNSNAANIPQNDTQVTQNMHLQGNTFPLYSAVK